MSGPDDDDDAQLEAAELIERILGLEGARILTIASLGRIEGVDAEHVREVDEAIEGTLEVLAGRGVAYPGHLLGGQYALSGPEYLVLQLALMPHHSPGDFAALMALLGSTEAVPRLSHALLLLAPPERHAEVAERLEQLPLFTESLVRRSGDADPSLVPHQAVLELYGLH